MSEIKTIKSKFMKNVFDQNTYVLINKNEVVIIDAGAELEDVLNAIGDKKVLAILVTHLHFDHIWNIEEYLNKFKCDLYICDGQEKRFLDNMLNGSFMVRQNITKNVSKELIKYYAKNLKIGSFNFEIFFTPGHTSDCVCIKWNENLFTGDTIFDDAIGRTDLPDSSNSDMINSLRLIQTIDFMVAYPGHYDSASKDKILKTISYYI